MKIAVIGSGPLAILSAAHFDRLGADVVLFQRSPLGGNLRFMMDQRPQTKITFEKKETTIESFFETVIVPAVLELEKYNLTKNGDVLRVHKRFLHPKESVPGKSRLHDLFRVIYSTNPQETILKQLEENPEFFNQLGEEVINSLHRPVESFEDFDIVIEARGLGKKPSPMGAGKSLALNEHNLHDSSLLFYEKDIFTKLNLEDKKNIVLVGEGASLKLALLKFKDWLLKSPGHELHWVTYGPAKTDCGIPWLDQEVNSFLSEIEERFDKAKLVFETKLREWRDLDDFVKVKIPKPIEPTPLLVIHEGYDVTSVDRLLDRPGVFATIESPDFRDFVKEPMSMFTLAADALCVARGVQETPLFDLAQNPEEPGYYVLNSSDLDSAGEQIALIEQKILNFFKKA